MLDHPMHRMGNQLILLRSKRILARTLTLLILTLSLLAPGALQANPQQELKTKGYAFTPTEFLRSASRGDLAAVNLFLSAGMRVDASNPNGETALFKADEAGQLKTVIFLLEKGASPKNGKNIAVSYIAAVESNNTGLQKRLLGLGMNRDYAISILADRSQYAVLEGLVKEGADPYSELGRASLVYVTEAGETNLLKFLVERGKPENRKGALDPALVTAARQGNMVVLRYLLNQGADASNPKAGANQNGLPAIGEAAASGKPEVVSLLLNHGADVNMQWVVDGAGGTPLISAAREGHLEVVRLLLSKGARDVGVRTASGTGTARSAAQINGHKAVVALLNQSRAVAATPRKADTVATPRKADPAESVITQIIQGKISVLRNPLRREDFRNVSRAQLRIIRNTIFAQHGYPFKSRDLQQHFARFSWYRRGDRSEALSRLSRNDKANIEMLTELE